MKKVAILVYDYSLYGGAEKVAINLANALSDYFEVSLISCFNVKKKNIFPISEKVKVFILSNKIESLTLRSFKISRKLKKILFEHEIDVLINITAGINTISYLATINSNIKVIYAEHSNLLNKSYGRKHEFRQWLGAKTSDLVVTLTSSDKEEFIKKFKIDDKCEYIYNWFDGVIKENYNHNSKKIITVGRLEQVKGYDRLIIIAKEFFKKNSDWTWDIYGEGSLKDFLVQKIKDNKLENNLILKGNDPNVIELYQNYAFFVLTSYYEGLPLVLLEAKANLLPIVSFDCPTGPSEIITNGEDGFLIENDNLNAMVEAIYKLSTDIKLREKFSNNSTRVLKKFKKNTIISKWVKIISDL